MLSGTLIGLVVNKEPVGLCEPLIEFDNHVAVLRALAPLYVLVGELDGIIDGGEKTVTFGDTNVRLVVDNIIDVSCRDGRSNKFNSHFAAVHLSLIHI